MPWVGDVKEEPESPAAEAPLDDDAGDHDFLGGMSMMSDVATEGSQVAGEPDAGDPAHLAFKSNRLRQFTMVAGARAKTDVKEELAEDTKDDAVAEPVADIKDCKEEVRETSTGNDPPTPEEGTHTARTLAMFAHVVLPASVEAKAKRKRRPSDSTGVDPDAQRVLGKPTANKESEPQWDDELPITGMSVDAAMPKGVIFNSLVRIRHTINSYTQNVCKPRWYQTMKVGTISALQRRLMNYEDEVVGKFNVEMQLAFKHLSERVASLLGLHRALRNWLDTQNEALLAETLPHYNVILKYLSFAGLTMAPDSGILCCFAVFHGIFMQCGSVAGVLRHFDTELLAILVTEAKDARLDQPVADEVKEEQNVKSKFGKRKIDADMKRQRFPSASLDSRIPMASGTHAHLAKMVSDTLRNYLFQLPADVTASTTKVDAVLAELDGTVGGWDAALATCPLDEGKEDDFGETLRAILCIAQCCCHDEKWRPHTSQVRASRRCAYEALKQPGSPARELARSMMTYTVPRVMMETSKIHAATGVEDDAATQSFAAAIDRFGNMEAFSDIDAWASKWLAGGACSYTTVKESLSELSCLHIQMVMSMRKWSNVAVQENVENMVVGLTNSMVILRSANYLLVAVFYELVSVRVQQLLARMGRQPSISQEPAPAVKADRDEGPEGFAEKAAQVTAEVSAMQGIADVGASLAEFVAGLQPVREELTSFAKLLSTNAVGMQTCLHKLRERVGDAVSESFGVEDDPNKVLQAIENNERVLLDMVDYFTFCDQLVSLRASASDHAVALVGDAAAKAPDQVICFARLQHAIEARPPQLLCPSVVTKTSVVLGVLDTFARFMDELGRELYRASAASFLHQQLDAIIATQSITIAVVHESVVAKHDDGPLLQLLIHAPKYEELVIKDEPRLAGNDTDMEVLTALPHNAALGNLIAFADASSLHSFAVPGVAHTSADGDKIAMPCAEALAVLKVVCGVKDVSILASIQQVRMLTPVGEGKVPAREDVFGKLAAVEGMLHTALVNLDCSLNSEQVVQVESAGWKLPCPMQTARQWAKLMSLFAGRCQDCLLKLFQMALTKSTEVCKAACPAWEAAFQKDGFDRALAGKIFHNKLKNVADTYNAVHRDMTAMNVAAQRLQVSPRLQDHEITSESIAVGLACLSRSSQASIMILGVSLMQSFEHDPAGPAKAKEFIEANKSDKTSDIPAAFWDELTHMAAGSALASPTKAPSLAQTSASAKSVKRCVHDSSKADGASASTASGTGPATESSSSTCVLGGKRADTGVRAASASGASSMKRFKKS